MHQRASGKGDVSVIFDRKWKRKKIGEVAIDSDTTKKKVRIHKTGSHVFTVTIRPEHC